MSKINFWSAKPISLADSFQLDDLVMQMAKRFKAVDDQGRIWCILCNDRPGIKPSLTCPECLAEHRRKQGR